ncbi:MAG: hypothetical protein KIY10_06900 [Thermoplasmata archaeon]|nr:hypothetical protein [Candidatus Sysuiplasma jiujiangense]
MSENKRSFYLISKEAALLKLIPRISRIEVSPAGGTHELACSHYGF